ncbi:MAG: DUF4159 domain-containing protein [Candidatus Eiseniibacteriota bacterium]|nr:MAG: DUF4159 domain-containing protein [Candidatus Eisenbacteria bacterium]
MRKTSPHSVIGLTVIILLAVSFLVLLSSSSSPARPVIERPVRDGFVVARLKYGGGGDWYGNKTSLRNLLRALSERTTVKVASDREEAVEIMEKEFFNFPFLWLSGHGNVRFTRKEAERLREHLTSGGFLFADDDYGMDKSFRQQMKQVFPDKELVELPFTHPIYHSFYELPDGPPKVHEHDGLPPRGYAIVHEGRVVVFYTHEADVGDGLEDPEIHGDPPEKREEAMKMAINVVLYSLTN